MGRNKDRIILAVRWEWLEWKLGYVGAHYPVFFTCYNKCVELSLKCSKCMDDVTKLFI